MLLQFFQLPLKLEKVVHCFDSPFKIISYSVNKRSSLTVHWNAAPNFLTYKSVAVLKECKFGHVFCNGVLRRGHDVTE